MRKGEAYKENDELVPAVRTFGTVEEDESGFTQLSDIPLNTFLSLLAQQGNVLNVEARVNIESLDVKGEKRAKADALAELVWQQMNYRFL